MKTRITGREPGRSTDGRLKLFARRGRFSPFYSFESRRGSAPAAFQFGERPPGRRRLAHRLRVVVALVTAGIIGISSIGVPVHASGNTRPKKKPARTKQVSSSSKGSSRKSTAPASDYKSKYKKKTPPPAGGHPRIQKQKRPSGYKPKERPKKYKDFTNDRRPPRRKTPVPTPRPRPDYDPPPVVYHEPVVIIYPPIYDEIYYGEPYYEETYYGEPYVEMQPSSNAFETASLLFAATSVAINYAFIRKGQIGEFAAGAGFVFGLAALATASKPNAQHPILGYLLGGASIAFAVWNLSGGMDTLHTWDQEPVYADTPYPSVAPNRMVAGWSFTF